MKIFKPRTFRVYGANIRKIEINRIVPNDCSVSVFYFQCVGIPYCDLDFVSSGCAACGVGTSAKIEREIGAVAIIFPSQIRARQDKMSTVENRSVPRFVVNEHSCRCLHVSREVPRLSRCENARKKDDQTESM